MENILFVCKCGDIDHQFVISEYDDDPENIYIQIHLSDVGIINRIKYAIKYILGKKSRFSSGSFGEIILGPKETSKLVGILLKDKEKN
jgi:hypothetical protein